MAAVLSFFLPGLGQLVQGRVFTAILAFILVLMGYCLFIVPGLIMHLMTILDAASWENRRRRKEIQELKQAIVTRVPRV